MDVGCNREGALARRFYLCAHYLLSYQWALLRSACLPLLHSLPSGIYTDWWDHPWLFFRMNHPTSLRHSSQKIIQLLNCFCGPELNSLHLDLCQSLHHLLSNSFPTWHLHQAFHNSHNVHIQAPSHLHSSQRFGSVISPLQSCCLPPWGYDCPSRHFSTVVQADL